MKKLIPFGELYKISFLRFINLKRLLGLLVATCISLLFIFLGCVVIVALVGIPAIQKLTSADFNAVSTDVLLLASLPILLIFFGFNLFQVLSIQVYSSAYKGIQLIRDGKWIAFCTFQYSLASLVLFVTLIGGYTLLIIPGVIMSIYAYFFEYEVVLAGRNGFSAIARSCYLVQKHFWGVILRLAPILLISVIVTIASNYSSLIPNLREYEFYIFGFGFVLSVCIGIYMRSFSVVLWENLSQIERNTKTSKDWMITLSAVGWIILVVLGISAWGFMSRNIDLQNLGNTADMVLVTSTSQTITAEYPDDVKPEVELSSRYESELYKLMPHMSFKTEAHLPKTVLSLADKNIQTLMKATESHSDNPYLWLKLGQAYTWPNTFEDGHTKGILAFTKALELSPDDSAALEGLGILQYENDALDDALINLGKAIEKNPSSYTAQLYLGRTYKKLGVKESAITAYKTCMLNMTKQNFNNTLTPLLNLVKKELLEVNTGEVTLL